MTNKQNTKHYFNVNEKGKVCFYGGSFKVSEAKQHFKELIDYFKEDD